MLIVILVSLLVALLIMDLLPSKYNVSKHFICERKILSGSSKSQQCAASTCVLVFPVVCLYISSESVIIDEPVKIKMWAQIVFFVLDRNCRNVNYIWFSDYSKNGKWSTITMRLKIMHIYALFMQAFFILLTWQSS